MGPEILFAWNFGAWRGSMGIHCISLQKQARWKFLPENQVWGSKLKSFFCQAENGAQGVVGAWYFHGFHDAKPLLSPKNSQELSRVISPKILLGRWVFQKTEGGTLLLFVWSVSVCLCERNMITKGCGFRSWRCHDGWHHYHPDHFL